LSLGDPFTSTTQIAFFHGGFKTNDHAVTAGSLIIGSAVATAVFDPGVSVFTLTGTGGVTFQSLWSCSTCPTATFKLNNASATNKTFAGGGGSFGTLWFTGAGTGAFIITGSNAFGTLRADTPPHTIRFTPGTTQTIDNWDISGTAGNLMTLESTAAGNTWVVSKATGSVSADYLSLQDSVAAGGICWAAGANSTNVSGNSGWTFAASCTCQPCIYYYQQFQQCVQENTL
jgi:hypothetical protein